MRGCTKYWWIGCQLVQTQHHGGSLLRDCAALIVPYPHLDEHRCPLRKPCSACLWLSLLHPFSSPFLPSLLPWLDFHPSIEPSIRGASNMSVNLLPGETYGSYGHSTRASNPHRSRNGCRLYFGFQQTCDIPKYVMPTFPENVRNPTFSLFATLGIGKTFSAITFFWLQIAKNIYTKSYQWESIPL